jgi:hypothetical protein
MRVPQVNERVKEAPAHALRAIFASIGQLLSVSDKVRNKPATPETAAPETATPETATPETAAPEMRAPQTAAPETAAPETVTPETVTPETVTPETVTPETAAPETVTPETVTPETKSAPATAGGHVKVLPPEETPEAPAASASTVTPEDTPAAAASAELPVPNYDDLTIASLRARLRNLSADQLAQLVAYEKSHANRADVITMFERRIAKLAEG